MMKKSLFVVSIALLLSGLLLSILFGTDRVVNNLSSHNSNPSELVKLDQATQTRLSDTYGKLPLSFEINKGQTDDQVKFISRGNGYGLFLTSNEAVLSLKKPYRQEKRGLPILVDKEKENLNESIAEQSSVIRMQ